MPPPALSRGDEHGETRGLSRPRRILAAIFCGFAALLPIVSVVAPKGTVVLLLLAAALAVPTYWWANRRIPVPDLRIAIALALFVAWCAIASAWSVDTARSLGLVLRITVILAAGMVLFPVAAALDEAARREIGRWLVVGLCLSLAFVAAETGLDYPVLRLFKTAEPGKDAVWFNRGAIAIAMIVWPVTAYLWKGRLGWKALFVPVLLGTASLFLESASATLGFAAGVAVALLAVIHRRAARTITIAAALLAFIAMPFVALELHNCGWHRADRLPASAQHRVEIWDFSVQRIAEKPVIGWGFDGSRHMGSLFPAPSDTGRDIAALHPHSVPLQVMLELGAVGAVIALAFLWLVVMRLDRISDLTRMFGQAQFAAIMAIGSVSHGAWQNWWLALVVSAALMIPLTAEPSEPEGAMETK